MFYRFAAIIALLSTSLGVQAQEVIRGSVLDKDSGEPLSGATLLWLKSGTGTATDLEGLFELEVPERENHDHDHGLELVVSSVGYTSDTLRFAGTVPPVLGIRLKSGTSLDEITIEGREQNVSFLNPVNTVTLGRDELNRAACCNLSESFETTNDVDVSFTDAATGAKTIRMLGLDGRFVQLQEEVMPGFSGLSIPYRLGFVPGTWIESIQITQGPGSVTTGADALAGQINVNYWTPENSDKFFLNMYGNSAGRVELNTHTGKEFNDKVGSALLLHGHHTVAEVDRNGDDFLDVPLSSMFVGMNRWKFKGEGAMRGQIGVRYVHQDLLGGQVGFVPEDASMYGVDVAIRRAEVWNKTGWINPRRPDRSIGLQLRAVQHDQRSRIGLRNYEGFERSLDANLQAVYPIGNGDHKLTGGASFRYSDIEESLTGIVISTFLSPTEIRPGVFSEYTFADGSPWIVVAGLRADYINRTDPNALTQLDMTVVTPRLHVRRLIGENTTIRISGGRGFRTVNPIVENASWMVSSREYQVQSAHLIEDGWSAGAGAAYCFKLGDREGTIRMDYRFTGFTDQVTVDLDADAALVVLRQAEGFSRSHAAQAELDMELVDGLEFRLAGKLEDVRVETNGILQRAVMVPAWRGLTSLGYTTDSEWSLDATLQVVGPARMFDSHPGEQLTAQGYSPVHTIVHAQVSKTWGRWNVYLGGENLTNFKMDTPVLGANDPFGPDFDAASVWGPVLGINGYAGLKYTLN
jgi:hypothetical protein